MSQVFKDALEQEFSLNEAAPKRLGAIADWFVDKIKKVAEASDLTKLTKEDFLAAVGLAYDKFIEPIDLPGPDAIVDPILKQLLLSQAGRMYDRLTAA